MPKATPMMLIRCLRSIVLVFVLTAQLLSQQVLTGIAVRTNSLRTITATINDLVFLPDSITIFAGDSVRFSLASIHDAVEVSEATWLANGNTSNGGFQVPFGGGLVVPAILGVGVHYYVCTPHAASGMKGRIFVTSATGVLDVHIITPTDFQLFQNYPNPFNPSTTVAYQLSSSAMVIIAVYNPIGQLVRVLYVGEAPPGRHTIVWNSKDYTGRTVESGVYFYRLQAGSFTATRKLILLR